MRKHFLLLFLMTVLPFTAFADEITVNLINLQYKYGDALPTDGEVTTSMFSVQGGDATLTSLGLTKQQVADALQINFPEGQPGKVGNYVYTLTTRADYNLGGHTIFLFGGGSDGLLKVVGRPITISAIAASKTFRNENPAFEAEITSGSMVGEEELEYTAGRQSTEEHAGTYENDITVTVTETEVSKNYDITIVPADFTINKRSIADGKLSVALSQNSFVYNGTAQLPDVTVKDITDGEVALEATDFEVAGHSNKDVPVNPEDTYLTVSAAAGGNYTFNSVNENFTITKAPLTISVKTAQKKEYGDSDPAAFQIEYDGIVEADVNADEQISLGKLTAPTEVTRVAGQNAGIYPITMSEDATATNYEIAYGTTPVYFSITAKALANEDPFEFVVNTAEKVYTGETVETNLTTATYNGNPLVAGTDYELSFANNINASIEEAEIIITGKNNFKGSIIKYFTISQAPIYIVPNPATKVYAGEEPELT